MTTPPPPAALPGSGLRTAQILVAAYAALSLLTVAAIAVLSAVAPSLVTPRHGGAASSWRRRPS
ncbi:hypothetical protein [Nonomuraea sp. NPDC005692]|uniref:hypothetical protein n=1 Tax=Nonomuraea sp. NPDC005692 TaxID=3157168 RepID=UPI0033FF708C